MVWCVVNFLGWLEARYRQSPASEGQTALAMTSKLLVEWLGTAPELVQLVHCLGRARTAGRARPEKGRQQWHWLRCQRRAYDSGTVFDVKDAPYRGTTADVAGVDVRFLYDFRMSLHDVAYDFV